MRVAPRSELGSAAAAGVVRGIATATVLILGLLAYTVIASVVEKAARAPAMRELRDGAHIQGRLDELAAFVSDAAARPTPHGYVEGEVARGEWSPLPLSVTSRSEGRVLTVVTVGDRVCAALELPHGASAMSVNGGPFLTDGDPEACVPDRRHTFFDRRGPSGDRTVHEKRNVVAYLLAGNQTSR